MTFRSIYRHGFARVASCTMQCSIADPAANAEAVLRVAKTCDERSAALAIFPELAVSGYAIDDLLLQDPLLDAVEVALGTIAEGSAKLLPLLLVGAPLRHVSGRIYNCAVAIHRGRMLGAVPKIHLPNYREFYEKRHFASGAGTEGGEIRICGQTVPFGPDLMFTAEDLPGFVVHAEVCEDFWVPIPPSSEAALAGATVLANLSASNITIAKADTRRLLCKSQSGRCIAAYLYSASGAGESTTDLAWDGQTSIAENGEILTETGRFPEGDQIAVADIDLDLLRQERMRMGSFDDNRRWRRASSDAYRLVPFKLDPPMTDIGLERRVERFPFVPADPARLEQDCFEAYNIQVAGLVQRLSATRDQAGGHRRFRRPGFDPCADRDGPRDGQAGPAALQHPGLYDAGIRHQRPHQGQRRPADGVAGRHVARAGYPPGGPPDAGRHEPPVRQGRAGL